MIPGRMGGHEADVGREHLHRVGRTAHLEGADPLQVLALEVQFDAEHLVERSAGEDRRAMHPPGNPVRRRDDVAPPRHQFASGL